MKRIMGLIIAAMLSLSVVTPALAADTVTADEVKEMMADGLLLSRQDFCDELLNIEVYDMEDMLAPPAPLGNFINPQNALVHDVTYYDAGKIKTATVEAWDDDGRVRSAHIGTNSEIGSYISTYEQSYQPAYDIYKDCGSVAEKINEAGIKNIISLKYNSILGLQIFAGKEIYVFYNGEIMTLNERFKKKNEEEKEANIKENELYEKKRALTPQDMLDKFDFVNEGFVFEKTFSLKPYKGAAAVFSDLGEDEFLIKATAMLSDRGIITGFEDGTFRPDKTLTRAEAAVMLGKLVKGEFEGDGDFPDTQNHWAREAVGYLTRADVIHGYEDGLFRPDGKLTYGHISILLYEILGYCANAVDDMQYSYENNIMYQLMEGGLFDGVSSFTSEAEITRGDFAKIVANAMDMFLQTLWAPIDGKTEPSFYAVGSEQTLAGYLDGKEIMFGEYRVSEAAYKEWRGEYTDWFYKTYADIINEEGN